MSVDLERNELFDGITSIESEGMVIICDIDLFVIYVSQGPVFSAKDYIIGRNIVDLCRPGNRNKLKRSLNNLLKGSEAGTLELDLLTSYRQRLKMEARVFVLVTHTSVIGIAFFATELVLTEAKSSNTRERRTKPEAVPATAVVELEAGFGKS